MKYYAYDGNGNCIQKSGEVYQNEYTYDRMNRLITVMQDGQEEKYTYDPVGNRLKKESVQGTETYYYNMKNQLTHIHNGDSTLRFLYDRQGNLLEEQGKANRKKYLYDTANRQIGIVSAETDDAKERYLQSNRYDGEGLRYETEENGKVIRFLFDRGELAQENREDEKISYVRGHRAISLSRSGKDRNYFVQDEMGSTLFLLDQAHEIRKTYRYDAFGNILKETGEIPNRLTYTGQIYDGAAIQYYLRARFYNLAIGQFMQEDTYRGDGLNLYAYCANNPVIYFDPSGHGLCPNRKTQSGNDGSKETRGYSEFADGMSPEDAARYIANNERAFFNEFSERASAAGLNDIQIAEAYAAMRSGDYVRMASYFDTSSPVDGAVFWSGNKDAAAAYASSIGGTIMEQTSGGQVFDNWRGLGGMYPDSYWGTGTPMDAKPLWEAMSSQYAGSVSGNVTYVHPSDYIGAVWSNTELPIVQGRMRQGVVTDILEIFIDGK